MSFVAPTSGAGYKIDMHHLRRLPRALLLTLLALPRAHGETGGSAARRDGDSIRDAAPSPSWASVKSALNERSSHARKYRDHPDAISPSDLRPGMKVVVTPAAFGHVPSLKKRLKGPIVMEVVKGPAAAGRKARQWFHASGLVYLRSPETGQVGVPTFSLQSEVYSTPDFAAHAPFHRGEYVQIGRDRSEELRLAQANSPSHALTVASAATPFIGRFADVADEDHYRVEVEAAGQFAPMLVLVPKIKLLGLPAGSRKAASAAIRKLPLVAPGFEPGEKVRYRSEAGAMREAFFRSTEGDVSLVEAGTGSMVTVASQRVFKVVGDVPAATPTYEASWVTTRLNLRDPLVMELLDAGAALTSHPDFLQSAPRERLEILTRHVQRSIPWTKAARHADLAGLGTFAKLITAGVSVCRHNSYLLGVILSEAGYVTRLVAYQPAKGDGHAWLEADLRQRGGALQTYIVDPSDEYEPVMEFGAAMKAAKDGASGASRWYLQPSRMYAVAQAIP